MSCHLFSLCLRNDDAIRVAMNHTLVPLLQADTANSSRVSATGCGGSVRERGLGRPRASTIIAVLIGGLCRHTLSASCLVGVRVVDVGLLRRFVISTKKMETAAFGGSAPGAVSVGRRL